MHRVIISTSIVEPEIGLATILLATRGATRSRLGRRQVEETMIKHRRADRARYQAYSFDPLANLTSAEAANLLGGEQLLWTEQSDPSSTSSSHYLPVATLCPFTPHTAAHTQLTL